MKIETLPPPPRPAQAAHKAGKRWRAPAVALIVLALAGGGWTVLQSRNKAAAPASPAAAGAAAPAGDKKAKGPDVYELAAADVAAIGAQSLSLSLPLSGSLAPISQATIKAKVSGEVREAMVREGMAVSQGQVLARLDQADLQARLTQQQAMLDEAQAKLAMASRNHANSQALLKQNYISSTSYDTTANGVELARANVKSASAMVDLARIALNDSVIRAPMSGVVSKRHVQAGEKVSPDMPVYTIVNLAELTLEAQVPTSEIPRVKTGQEVAFKVDGFQREFHGKVARINPTAEPGSRAMLVYISVENKDGALLGGMFAKGHIVTERTAVMPLVPVDALRNDGGRQVVYKVDQGKVVAQPVTLGLRNDDTGYAEVTEGLQAGAQVIVAKLDAVKPGAKVKLAVPPGEVPTPAPATATAKASTPGQRS
ncbi:MFP transporter [Massilia sp. Root418]|jgi:RND family efflux transporter MFP subunit|uniref:efflux RND transporter periplasmic adaptor subunit n=1 Tax=Massilia sp. Root418 TaxID=1736532 RepID=UPI0006FC2B5F|nr:efflux RND transporter periplasmic adaptor subunit [Massilia sp. Root418]KQW96491.1 MFP transporter [Massilia sp. Root418]